ncbi:unnamed protein product [Spirodela intermedia]|uniref:Uncharacterized protein n=1 Tax=Spirodela intermedia TaxID=51605 RepID=A0A7I8IFX3_SPIIN|nr:unnamed protein product [Spirodela intermedia]CAA6656800.1 unnamed protein product [Spirodela intermedia]
MASSAAQLTSLKFHCGFAGGRPAARRPPPCRSAVVVAAVGDVSAEGTTYLVAGAIAVALVGTAFPILFSPATGRFIRKSGVTLRANAARKDQAQIVCPNCNGLGKLGQIDK